MTTTTEGASPLTHTANADVDVDTLVQRVVVGAVSGWLLPTMVRWWVFYFVAIPTQTAAVAAIAHNVLKFDWDADANQEWLGFAMSMSLVVAATVTYRGVAEKYARFFESLVCLFLVCACVAGDASPVASVAFVVGFFAKKGLTTLKSYNHVE